MSNNYSLFLFIFLFFAQLTGLFCEDLLEPSEPLDETEVQEEDIEPPDIEEEKEEETTGEEEDGELTLFQKTLSLDIEGSDYYELYSWCLSLNLDITGDSNVLKQRLYEYYDTPPPLEEPEEGEEKQNIITIRSANSTEYFSIEEVDEEYLLLQGNVIIEIDDQEEGSKHIIKAERIVVNETQHVLTATGNIEYILIRNKGNENEGKDVFIGDNFTFNIDNWSTVFIDATGETNREVEEGEEVDFYYIGENLTRLENDVVILDGGIITSCDDENPHWKLKASKIWVLAPGEFAVKNAVLYLGHVPVFYLPFFFKAGDEMFFHPSIGYRDKEGYFINNTIYILGQKKPSSTGAFSFLKTESETTYYDIELKGLFLRKGEKIEIDESMQKIFKVMLDIYSRLGGFMGVLLHFPGIWDLKGGIGFSRSLREDGNIYTPYDTDSMESHWNKSYFWGLTLPFRFGWESELNIDRTIFDLSYNFDLFSDPYFREDFYIREEDFSWQKVLRKQFGKEFEEEETATDAWELQPEKVSDYTWYLLNSYTFTFNNPYLNKLEIQNIKFNLAWGSKEDTSLTQSTDAWDQINPKREFFYPNRLFSPESLKIKISGTLLQLTSGKKEEEIEEIQEESPGKGIHYPDIPEIQKGEEEIEEFEKESDLPRMIVPDAMVDTPIETETKENNQFTLSYSIEPSLNIEKQFDIENWDSANEVDFKTQYSVLNTGGNFDLVYNMVLFNGYLKSDGKIIFDGRYQQHYKKNVDIEDWDNKKISDYQSSGIDLMEEFAFKLSPLKKIKSLAISFLQYNLDWTFYSYEFKEGESIAYSPVFTHKKFKWNDEKVTEHTISAKWSFMPKTTEHYLDFKADIPPRDLWFRGILDFTLSPLNSKIEGGYKKQDNTWVHDDFLVTETLTISPWFSLIEYLKCDFNSPKISAVNTTLKLFQFESNNSNYILEQELNFNPSIKEFEKIKTTINLWPLTASLEFERMKPVRLDLDTGDWVTTDSQERLLPKLLSFNLVLGGKERFIWRNRINFSNTVTTSWNLYLQEFTESKFIFNYALTISIYQFLDFTFSVSSVNNNTYRYFSGFVEKTQERKLNPFLDLIRSFNFFNKDDRYDSNFNLESINFSIVHHLHDWDLVFQYTGVREKTEDGSKYEWKTEYSIILEWNPIPELKHQIIKEKDEDEPRFRG